MAVTPKFKQTEVGVIPEDWDVVIAFDACSKIQDGTHFSPRSGGNDYFYVTSKNIRSGYLDMSTASRIDATQHQAIYRRCDVRKGDLLITKDGANTGNAALNKLDDEFSLLSSVAFLRFNQNKHVAAYFLQQVLTSQGQRQIQDAMAGNAITRLTLEKINKLRFPVPPTKAEQEAIAAALSDADALIESLEQLITKKRHIKQGAMHELLTGRKRLPGFSGEWEISDIGNKSTKIGSGITPTGGNRVYVQIGRPFLRSQNIGRGVLLLDDIAYIDEDTHATFRATEIEVGDVFLNITGASIGRSAVADFRVRKGNVNQHVCIIRADLAQMSPQFLNYYLLSDRGQKQIDSFQAGGNRQGLNFGQIRSMTIHLPYLEEQTAIAAILFDMDAEIASLEQRLSKTRQIKQGMMHNLLTGKIRLI